MTKLIEEAKEEYYSSLIINSKSDQKALFKIIKNLLHKNNPSTFPSGVSDQDLALSFGEFFHQMIQDIRSTLDKAVLQPRSTQMDTPLSYCMNTFSNVSSDSLFKLIQNSPSKSCKLDALPTELLKSCSGVLLKHITFAINLSLSSGQFPRQFKNAIITPLLKKPGLDPVLSNYWPISNLPFLSKLLERVAASQLLDYMHSNSLFEPLQSAYWKFHSTETALLKIQNDVLCSMDHGGVTLLVLLDLSAAFDTVDHHLLLSRLKTKLGLSGTVLQWCTSYLILINNTLSSKQEIQWGVPQGSVLGPLLFSIYLLPLGDIIRQHNLTYHIYADDVQLYLSFHPGTVPSTAESFEHCIQDIRSWMTTNKLKLNGDKTEFILLGRKCHLSKTVINQLSIGGSCVSPSSSVRNLGVLLDSELSMQPQISSVCKSAYFHLRNIARI